MSGPTKIESIDRFDPYIRVAELQASLSAAQREIEELRKTIKFHNDRAEKAEAERDEAVRLLKIHFDTDDAVHFDEEVRVFLSAKEVEQ